MSVCHTWMRVELGKKTYPATFEAPFLHIWTSERDFSWIKVFDVRVIAGHCDLR